MKLLLDTPLETDLVLVQRLRAEAEFVEERGDEPHGSTDQVIRVLVLARQEVEKRSEVGAVVTQETVVVHIARLLDRRRGARVVEVVDAPTI